MQANYIFIIKTELCIIFNANSNILQQCLNSTFFSSKYDQLQYNKKNFMGVLSVQEVLTCIVSYCINGSRLLGHTVYFRLQSEYLQGISIWFSNARVMHKIKSLIKPWYLYFFTQFRLSLYSNEKVVISEIFARMIQIF